MSAVSFRPATSRTLSESVSCDKSGDCARQALPKRDHKSGEQASSCSVRARSPREAVRIRADIDSRDYLQRLQIDHNDARP